MIGQPSSTFLIKKRAKLLGITIPGTGEVHCKFAIKNVLDLVHLAGRSKENIRVSCGDEVPMEGVHAFPDAWRKDVDHLRKLIKG
jgi:hypothetical protein